MSNVQMLDANESDEIDCSLHVYNMNLMTSRIATRITHR